MYVEAVDYLPGLAGESRNFDANGAYIRVLLTAGSLDVLADARGVRPGGGAADLDAADAAAGWPATARYSPKSRARPRPPITTTSPIGRAGPPLAQLR